ncbi:MAG: prolyl oligopeptidase family serine peptidase [Vicinamibacterales bacterium]
MRLLRCSPVALIAAMIACGGAGAPAAPADAGGFITSGDIRLAYSLDLPSGAPPYPAIVAGHGSGRVTRQQLEGFAQRWTSLGFAVLRYDKRGVGESTGTYSEVGSAASVTMIPLLAGDVAAAARFLRARPEIDSRRVGLAGASQAGWILPHAARELGGVAFMVLLSGPVCSVGLENYYSDLADGTSRPLDEVYTLLPSFSGFNGYDPVPVLQAIDTPTLWLLGADDRSIPVRTTVANLEILARSGKPFEWRTYPGLGHGLSGVVWADIETWIQKFQQQ